MDKLIPEFYRTYGKYVNSSRAFPLNIDGLKPVERRVLLSAYQIARDKFTKSARIDGHLIGHYHPHGTGYGSLVQLVRQGFLDGQGNFGCNLGVESSPPAAMRYTECKLSRTTLKMAFELIKYVKWVDSELDDEPEFLPTMFPFCLLGNEPTQGIGFGYRTHIPCYTIEDLYKRLIWLLSKKGEEPIIKPITTNKILSDDNVVKELLTTGKATIEVQGRFTINKGMAKINVKSWPPGKRFESILSKFNQELINQDIGFQDLSSGENSTMIVFEVLKQRNRETIFNKFIPKLQKALLGTINYEIMVVGAEQKVFLQSVDQMLLDTFKEYVKVTNNMLISEIKRIEHSINELDVLIKLKPYISTHLSDNESTVDESIARMSNDSGVDPGVIQKLLSKYPIRKLLSLNTDTRNLHDELDIIRSRKDNIDSYVIGVYQDFLGVNSTVENKEEKN